MKIGIHFIRVEREADWCLHMVAMKRMLPYFFAAGHVHCARYGLYYLSSKELMQDKCHDTFMKGEHVMRYIPDMWNGIWSDMYVYIETTIIRYLRFRHYKITLFSWRGFELSSVNNKSSIFPFPPSYVFSANRRRWLRRNRVTPSNTTSVLRELPPDLTLGSKQGQDFVMPKRPTNMASVAFLVSLSNQKYWIYDPWVFISAADTNKDQDFTNIDESQDQDKHRKEHTWQGWQI